MVKVSEIMTRSVITIRGSAPVAAALQRMLQQGIHALVVDRQHPQDAYGIITDTDIVTRALAFGRDLKRLRVYEIMSKPCIVVNPDLAVEYVARLFSNTGISVAPVIQSELLGIVTITDLLTHEALLSNPQETQLTDQIDQAIALAEQTCQTFGKQSQQCVEAWAKVDALQTEWAYQTQTRLDQTAYDAFRASNPDALKLEDYDNWCSG
ncbi:CBS domain-containing protein [Nodosilinea sp. P-1105]|uniref:CBS domain-containing protein n=1 Tax=Nodosilinea sp. P-1105 TaxID=2546229 RepID=UPI00146B4916|nr:CBS domain-containing protein [Nodosilinea sp. P-1105]NMF82997.1 CBS domain-containing protein [Nodosilinea sp. P-1105]